jgi:CheY-like chemotaxis protein
MKTVLVVDDVDTFRQSVRSILQKFGFRVLLASDGRQALEMVPTELPDLILLDVTMPVMDGIAFLTELRADKISANIPVILLTGLADRENVTQAAKLGVAGYLVKASFSASYLLGKIEEVLKINLDFMNSKSKEMLYRSEATLPEENKTEKNS